MEFETSFRTLRKVPQLLASMEEMSKSLGEIRLMEICGTHTMAISKGGIRSMLPASIRLLSGPGCPVCVTPAGEIDEILRLSQQKDVMIATYGDLLRVPGSLPGDTLLKKRAAGACVKTVFSPMDALALAEENPHREVVFLGVGFETTAPGTAACILEAAQKKLPNFSVLCLLKRTEPALRSLIAEPDFSVNGFLCPGHVAVITGADAFSFLPEEFSLPAVVSGFEPGDILFSIYRLVTMLYEKNPQLENEYTRLVKKEGNPAAKTLLEHVFSKGTGNWRGLGRIPESGYRIREEYTKWDAYRRFGLSFSQGEEPAGCMCGQIIRGALSPKDCPLFGTSCTPIDPVGPCMVSGEGACAAAYRYDTF